MSGISIQNFSFSYGGEELYRDFSMDFEEGGISAVLGSSGVGKTTLLNAIAGLVRYSGTITGVPERISCIFQRDRLVPSLTVSANLNLVLKDVFPDRKDRERRIGGMLDRLEIAGTARRLPSEISGGQLRRAAMARAFLYPAGLMILDEPFRELDVSLKTRLIKVFLNLWKEEKRTVIMVTHDVYEALLMADAVAVISGKPAETVYSARIETDRFSRRLTDPELTPYRDGIIEKII